MILNNFKSLSSIGLLDKYLRDDQLYDDKFILSLFYWNIEVA